MSQPCRLLVAGHDPGALSVLGLLLAAWADDPRLEARFLGTPAVVREVAWSAPAARMVPWAGELTEAVTADPAALDRVLERHLRRSDWDAVLCGTSGAVALERRVLQRAGALGLPTLAYCDMWSAYEERFGASAGWVVPDVVLAVDARMAAEMAELGWPRPPHVVPVGHPFYERSRRHRAAASTPGRTLRFLSEPASSRYPAFRVDEFEIAELVLAARSRAGCDRPFVVRTHPGDAIEPWRRFAWRHRDEGVALDILPLEACLADTWAAVGISTVLLIEMAMAGIPVASVQPPQADGAYFCLPYQERGIVQLSDIEAVARWMAAPASPAVAPEITSDDAVARITGLVLDVARRSAAA